MNDIRRPSDRELMELSTERVEMASRLWFDPLGSGDVSAGAARADMVIYKDRLAMVILSLMVN
jgi:hypothetical protein